MKHVTTKALLIFGLAISLASCSNESSELLKTGAETTVSQTPAIDSSNGESSGWTLSSSIDVYAGETNNDLNLAAVLGDREIPYPVYPNGSHYRIGDENGLNIIVFQTEDTFEQVDAYYQSKAGLPRLSSMKDYVRYSTTDDDRDPWQTDKPGIVIHEFTDNSERIAIGADEKSRTNIIMSFK